MRGSGKKMKSRLRKEAQELRTQQRTMEYLNRLTRTRMSKKTKTRSKRSTYRKTASSRENTILQNANNPLYTSCKYFAAREYFKYFGYSGKTLEDKVYYMIDGKYGLSERNKLPIFEPNGAEALPDGLTLCFITYLPGFSYESPKNSTPIIHGFLLSKTPQGYFIYSSWGCIRSTSQEEYEEYSKTMYGIGETPVNIENYVIHTIERKPTKQGPFSEDELRDALSNLNENVQKLFGLTESEIQFVEGQFDHIQIQMYKGN